MKETAHQNGKVIERVLCAIDLGPASERVLDWAYKFAGDYGATVIVLHVVPSLEPTPGSFDPSGRAKSVDGLEDRIRCLQAKIGACGAITIEEGSPAEAVAMAAARASSDVLVIGRSPEEGRLRANAYAIIRESPCPVVSV